MTYELHKNAIITGGAGVDFFCLACNIFIQSQQEAYCHIELPSHCEKITSIPTPDKYKRLNIIKTGAGYFCTFCNILIHTTMKIDAHLMQDDHIQNRGNVLFKRVDRKIIAYNNIHIKDNVWHGLKENECSICEIEFQDENQHKNETLHILNLIQKPVKFGSGDAVYRKIDQSTVQCLTCDVILFLNTLDDHFKTYEHLECYENCIVKADSSETCVEPPTETQVNTNISNNSFTEELIKPCTNNDNEYKESPLDLNGNNKMPGTLNSLVEEYKRNMIDINFETDTAFCKKCSVPLKFNQLVIDAHIKIHTEIPSVDAVRDQVNGNETQGSTVMKDSKATDSDHVIRCKDNLMDNANAVSLDKSHSKSSEDPIPQMADPSDITISAYSMKSNYKLAADTDEIKIKNNSENPFMFAKENYIAYNAHNGNAFCRLCQVRLPSSVKSMEEHIKGLSHTRNVAKLIQNKNKVKVPIMHKVKLRSFVYSLTTLQNNFLCNMVVNNEYHITDISFFLFVLEELRNELECLLCRTTISYIPIFYKEAMSNHVKLHNPTFWDIPVIKSVQAEFIREIFPDKFHCGYCNIVEAGWKEMEYHIKSASHEQRKTARSLLWLVQRNRF